MPAIGRDEATVMLALLAGAADGQPQPEEEKAILARLGPQLRRLGPAGQLSTLARLGELLDGLGLDRTLSSLRAALPVPAERMDAVRTAIAVAFADGEVTAAEARRVAVIADAMGLTEAELRTLLPAGRGGAPGAKGKAR